MAFFLLRYRNDIMLITCIYLIGLDARVGNKKNLPIRDTNKTIPAIIG